MGVKLVFTLQNHFVDFGHDQYPTNWQLILCSAIKASVKYEDSQHFVSRNLRTVGRLLQFTKLQQ